MKHILILFFLSFASLAWGQSVEQLEKQLKEASTGEEKMNILFELAAQSLRSSAEKAEDYGKQAHNLAVSAKDYGMAAQSAWVVAQAFNRQRGKERYEETWLSTTYNYAKQAGDSDLIIKSVDKRGRLWTKENPRRAVNIYEEAFAYFSTKGTSISDLERKYERQRAQLERQKRELEDQKVQLENDIQSLVTERDQLSTDKTVLQERQDVLVQQKAKVEEKISEKEEAIASISEEKAQVEAMAQQNEAKVKQLSRAALEQQAALDAARADVAEANLAAERNRNTLYLAFLGVGFTLILTLLTYGRYRSSRRAKRTLEEKNKIIEKERENSDNLLLNILPKSIADELKANGKARAQRFEQVTVLLTDFKNFTQISEQLGPEELVSELDKCFKGFDFIIQQYADIEKIKTIGDAYMCASGLTTGSAFPDNMVRAALEMQQFLEEQKQENIRMGRPFFEARIGIHTGPVVAGVVGVKKFAYDIWGDTVNIAARMEANCEEGQINISQNTYQWVASRFECQYRGKVEAKNKGAIDMYYVKREHVGAVAV